MRADEEQIPLGIDRGHASGHTLERDKAGEGRKSPKNCICEGEGMRDDHWQHPQILWKRILKQKEGALAKGT